MALAQRKRRTCPARRTRKMVELTAEELRSLIENLIDRKLASHLTTPARPLKHTITAPMRQRALSAAGRFRSGYPDLSTRHDEYLSEDYRT